jgi:hypothetical protein
MTVGSNQPYLFPYIGYWQLMNISDYYVISDSMQYIKKGYINRNNILVDGKKHMFTLEVLGVHSQTPINEVVVGNNAKKILKSIFHAYRKAPFFDRTYPLIEELLLHDETNLARFVGNSIEKIAAFLEMDTRFLYLSDLQGETVLKGQERTIDICRRMQADCYINAIGGQALYDKESFKKAGIQLNFLKSETVEYQQFDNAFVSNLSIIDIMMFNSKDEIKKMMGKYVLI